MATLKSNNLRLTSALQVRFNISRHRSHIKYELHLQQESTANVDEWKRQLHSYKEENQRLKIRYQELEASKGSSSTGSSAVPNAAGTELTEEFRREITLLKSRIEDLEKELMNQEIELKAANKSLKEKQNDPTVCLFILLKKNNLPNVSFPFKVKQLTTLCNQFGMQITELSGLQKEMEKVIQAHHKTT